MGNAMYDLSVPVIKGTNSLLAFSGAEDKTTENPSCIRCGRCVSVCPMRLMPLFMYIYERKDDFDNMEKYRLTDCIECGACTYTCPGRLHLTHSFRAGKAKIAAKAAADKARLERMKAEAAKALLGGGGDK